MTPRILTGLVGAFFGWSMARLISNLSALTAEPGHYRVESALSKLSGIMSLPPVVWIAGSGIMCFALWWLLTHLIAAQGRFAGARTASVVFLPMGTASAINFFLGDPTVQSGRLWLTAAAGLAIAGTAVTWSYALLWPAWSRTNSWQPRAGFVWALSIILYAVLGLWMSTIMEPTGDEPHYLLGMHSLIHDGDLDVANNHEQQDYLHFYPTEIHNAQMLATKRGITLPKHSIGFMVLGAPLYALAGRTGVSIFAALICALLACTVYHYVSREMDKATGLAVWSAILLAAPLVLYPGQLYPNALTGLLLSLALLMSSQREPGKQVIAGLAAGLMPWFHLGTWPLSVAALVAIVLQRKKSAVPAVMAACVPWVGLLAMHVYYWGGPVPPVSTYGSFSLFMVPAGLAGQFLDQEYGILWIAPIWWLVLPGIITLLRHGRSFFPSFLAVCWVFYISTFNWWYGGWCPTGRFLLPAIVLLSMPLAVAIHRLNPISRILWLCSGLSTIVLTAFPFFRYNAHDGSHSVLDSLGRIGTTASALMPSVIHGKPVVWIVWLAFSGIGIWYAVRKLQRS